MSLAIKEFEEQVDPSLFPASHADVCLLQLCGALSGMAWHVSLWWHHSCAAGADQSAIWTLLGSEWALKQSVFAVYVDIKGGPPFLKIITCSRQRAKGTCTCMVLMHVCRSGQVITI